MEKRDKLAVVSIETDDEVILHISLKGPPKEYLPFCSVMRTRNGLTNFDDLHIVVISKEYSIKNIVEDKQEKNIMSLNFTSKKFNFIAYGCPRARALTQPHSLTLGGRYGHLFQNTHKQSFQVSLSSKLLKLSSCEI